MGVHVPIHTVPCDHRPLSIFPHTHRANKGDGKKRKHYEKSHYTMAVPGIPVPRNSEGLALSVSPATRSQSLLLPFVSNTDRSAHHSWCFDSVAFELIHALHDMAFVLRCQSQGQESKPYGSILASILGRNRACRLKDRLHRSAHVWIPTSST